MGKDRVHFDWKKKHCTIEIQLVLWLTTSDSKLFVHGFASVELICEKCETQELTFVDRPIAATFHDGLSRPICQSYNFRWQTEFRLIKNRDCE